MSKNVAAAPLRDRVRELRRVRAADLRPNPLNWRVHPPAQREALRGLLHEIGYADALLAREDGDGDLILIDGHLRADLTPDQEVPVLVLDLNEAEADMLLATLDPLASMAEADTSRLHALLGGLESESDAVRALLDGLAVQNPLPVAEGLTDPDAVPELLEEPISKPGDLWICGDHRLLCGDATKTEDVERLMAGEKAGALFIGPPYGINRDPAWLDGVYRHRRALSSRDVIPGDDGNLDLSFLFAFERRMIWGFPYIFDPGATGWIVWDKQPGVDRRGIVTPIEMASTTLRKGFDMARVMWGGYYRAAGEERMAHPTQKPVGVVLPYLEAWTSAFEMIYDAFLGSGTTMIACERLGRRCYGMEIKPGYVDVAVQRWEKFTGRKAARQNG